MKYDKKEDNIIMNLLCFGLGLFTTYFVISLFGGRILGPLEYANFKTLDYKIELIKAYQEYHTATKQLILNDPSAVKAEQRVDNIESLEDCPE